MALGGRASIDIDAPIAACWAVVEDIASSPTWQKGLEAMDVDERDAQGRVLRAEMTSDAKVRMVKAQLVFAYAEPTSVSWTQEKGDLKALRGGWELEALDAERTRATYVLDGDPGRMLAMLVRGPVEERIQEILVNARPGELKAKVEG